MAQLDKLLSVLFSSRADRLHLADDAPALLVAGVQERALTKPLTGPQVLGLLREVAPAAVQGQLDAGPGAQFTYAHQDGAVGVEAVHEKGRWRAWRPRPR